MADARRVLITGATGKQGGAVCRHLFNRGLELRAMTRNPSSEAARTLAGSGVEVVQGDLDSTDSLRPALDGVWGVYAVQNTWEAGVDKEEEQGKRFAKAAKDAGVEHFVYTSVGSAHRNTGIPHFDNKWRVEEVIRSLGFASYTIFRPVFFMENLISPWFLNDDKIVTSLRPGTVVQMIAVEDIGRVEAQAFLDPEGMNGEEIDLAGDAVTIPAAAAAIGEAKGRSIEVVHIPMEAVRQNSEDFALMLEWFERIGYNADIPALEARFGPMQKLPEWAKRNAR